MIKIVAYEGLNLKRLFLLFVLVIGLSASDVKKVDIKSSVVKIFTVSANPVFKQPWTSTIGQATGSGCIIGKDKILTNAHVVTHASFIEVLKNGDTKKYEAKILSICHECDLALITVKDKSFFDATKPLEIGKLPKLQEKVDVYGFPEGGETLSITSGVISRIEHQVYVHSNKSLLAIQIDAPINPGNSGGPAISGGKIVGIVMQGRTKSQNIGYIIPTTQIKHYLKDIEDGKVDGYPFLGVFVERMENPSIKEMFNLKNKKIGILINKVVPDSPAHNKLKHDDIITEIDGYKLYSNARVEFRKGEYTSFSYAIDQHQIGDEVECKVIRNGKEVKLKLKLNKREEELMLVKINKFLNKPPYYIYGGYVFVKGSFEYRVPIKYFDEFPTKDKKEIVLLTRVLPSELTKGYDRIRNVTITKVNGKSFKDFKEFVQILENSKERFTVFEDEYNYKIVLKREDVLKKQKEILSRYNIKTYKSEGL